MTAWRVWMVAAVLAVGGMLTRQSVDAEHLADAHLAQFPMQLATWAGSEEPAFSEETLQVLGADEYLNRLYATRAGDVVSFYVGFYGSQRRGDAIHSPLNCLPGTGWQPLSRAQVLVPAGNGTSVPATRLVVDKGGNRALVLYWYEGRGRSVAGDYANRFWLMADAIRYHRTDGALVRVMTPIVSTPEAADAIVRRFVSDMYPVLKRQLPGAPV